MSLIREGFYKLHFGAVLPGEGIVVVRGDSIVGGDQQMVYTGTFGLQGSGVGAFEMTAKIKVREHVKGGISVFGSEVPSFELDLKGVYEDVRFHLTGPSPFGVGPEIKIVGHYLFNTDLK